MTNNEFIVCCRRWRSGSRSSGVSLALRSNPGHPAGRPCPVWQSSWSGMV